MHWVFNASDAIELNKINNSTDGGDIPLHLCFFANQLYYFRREQYLIISWFILIAVYILSIEECYYILLP